MPSNRRHPSIVYIFLALGVVSIAVAGYAGYSLYPRFDLPAVEGLTLLDLASRQATPPPSPPQTRIISFRARAFGEGFFII